MWNVVMLGFLLAAAAGDGPRAVLVVRGAGLDDATLSRIRQKAVTELEATGLSLWRLSAELDVTKACLAEARCVKELERAGDAVTLVHIEVVRAGRKAQLATAVHDASGTLIANEDTVMPIADVLGERRLFADVVRVRLGELARVVEPAAGPPARVVAPPPAPSDVVKPVAGAQPKTAPKTAAAAVTLDEGGYSAWTWTGATLLGVGVVGAATGAIVGVTQVLVLQDAQSLGEEKATAATIVPIAFSVAGVGVAVAIIGGALLGLGAFAAPTEASP